MHTILFPHNFLPFSLSPSNLNLFLLPAKRYYSHTPDQQFTCICSFLFYILGSFCAFHAEWQRFSLACATSYTYGHLTAPLILTPTNPLPSTMPSWLSAFSPFHSALQPHFNHPLPSLVHLSNARISPHKKLHSGVLNRKEHPCLKLLFCHET